MRDYIIVIAKEHLTRSRRHARLAGFSGEQNHFRHEKRSSVRLTYSASNDIDIMMLIFIIKCPISITSKIEGKPKILKLEQAIRLICKLNRRRPRACKLRAISLCYSYYD